MMEATNQEDKAPVAQAATASSVPLDAAEADLLPTVSIDGFPTDWDQTTEYPAIRAPLNRVGDLRRHLTGVLLNRPKQKCIYPCPLDPTNRRLLLLDPNQHSTESPNVMVQLLLTKEADLELTSHSLNHSYKDLTVEQVLRRILPESCHDELPSAFEQVGPICHVNLRQDLLPYKFWIGKVLLDKNYPSIKTVVTKLGNIETEFRTFAMQVIAGDDSPGWSVVTVKEEGCSFQLDFQQVYWNSRLAGEHRRMVQQIQAEAAKTSRPLVVADLMAGVGPFAVPLTATMVHKKRIPSSQRGSIRVFANDLNPASFQYLQVNADMNKCENLQCCNLDARAMVHKLQDEGIAVDHFLMNLPKIAPDFLDSFRGYHTSGLLRPIIHVYCFAPKASESNGYPDAVERCEHALNCKLDQEPIVRTVRNIAPTKNMVCVSFVLPQTASQLERIVLQQNDSSPSETIEPDSKRIKTVDK